MYYISYLLMKTRIHHVLLQAASTGQGQGILDGCLIKEAATYCLHRVIISAEVGVLADIQ